MYISKKEAAKRLGCAPQTVDRMVRDGELSAVEYYGRRRYDEDSVEKCRLAHTVKPRRKEIYPGVTYTPGMKLV